MENIKITFDKSAKREILDIFDKTIKDKFIVEKSNTDQKVLTSEGQEITIDEFAGIKVGSEIIIKKDLISLMRISKEI